MRWSVLLAVTVPAIVLAGLGLTHPHHLDSTTAGWWTDLHVVLIPIFPLLGVAYWVLLRGRTGVLAWIARIAAFCYIGFYGALDALAGIGTGTVMLRSGARGADERPEIEWLFNAGNQLGRIGSWSLLIAAVLTSIVLLLERRDATVIAGGIVLVLAGISFLNAHIYWPHGVLTMLAMALGFGLLAWDRGAQSAERIAST